MFGYFKADPTSHVLHFTGGALREEGAGLSFLFYAPTTSIAVVPLGSIEAPFMLERITADFQVVTVQGHVTYRIADPGRAAQLLNFVIDLNTRHYRSDDPTRLQSRVVNKVDVFIQQEFARLTLREALRGAEPVGAEVSQKLSHDAEMEALGIEVLALSLLAIKPVPETARALEAEAREAILRRADEALYSRRNAAVEQERAIRENELNTEIAVEVKKRQIRETQMDARAAVHDKRHAIEAADLIARIELEEKRRGLVALAAENSRMEADVRAYAMTELMKSFGVVDARIVQALATSGMQPAQIMAGAFQGLAEHAGKIGQLNVSPDLLRELLHRAE